MSLLMQMICFIAAEGAKRSKGLPATLIPALLAEKFTPAQLESVRGMPLSQALESITVGEMTDLALSIVTDERI